MTPTIPDVLAAIADGRISRGGTGIAGTYTLDGHCVRLALASMRRDGLVELPLAGPPRLTPDGRIRLTAGHTTGS